MHAPQHRMTALKCDEGKILPHMVWQSLTKLEEKGVHASQWPDVEKRLEGIPGSGLKKRQWSVESQSLGG